MADPSDIAGFVKDGLGRASSHRDIRLRCSPSPKSRPGHLDRTTGDDTHLQLYCKISANVSLLLMDIDAQTPSKSKYAVRRV